MTDKAKEVTEVEVEAVEPFEPILVEYSLEAGKFEFTLQLEEDLEIYNEFDANMKLTRRLMKYQESTSKVKVPSDRKVKNSKAKEAAEAAGFNTFQEVLGIILYVFGEDSFDALVDYYGEKNGTGDLDEKDFVKLNSVVFSVIYPKLVREN